MIFKKYSLLSLFLLLFLKPALTQTITLKSPFVSWSQTQQLKNSKWGYTTSFSIISNAFDERFKNVNFPATIINYSLQGLGVYWLSPNLQIGNGYVYQNNNPLLSSYANEHRIINQIVYNHNVSKFTFANRLRFEERWIENATTHKTFDFNARFRYLFGLSMPLKGKAIVPKTFYLNSFVEQIVAYSGLKFATFAENWDYVGIGYQFPKFGRLEGGYMLQWQVRNPAQDYRYLHILYLQWNTNFNFL